MALMPLQALCQRLRVLWSVGAGAAAGGRCKVPPTCLCPVCFGTWVLVGLLPDVYGVLEPACWCCCRPHVYVLRQCAIWSVGAGVVLPANVFWLGSVLA